MNTQWYDFALHVEKRLAPPFQAAEDDLIGFNGGHLMLGNRIRDWNGNAWIRSKRGDDDGVPDDVLSEHLGVPTFSKRLRDALKVAGVGTEDLQYLPVNVFTSTGDVLPGYAFANVLTRVKALDYARTDWGPLPPDPEEGIDPNTGKPRVQAIWRAALVRANLRGHDVIRLAEFFPPVYVSERFADVYRDGDFTGATLTPVNVTDEQDSGFRDSGSEPDS